MYIRNKVWKKKSFIALALLPLSLVFLAIIIIRKKVLLRKVFNRKAPIEEPVIIVGNISVGGTGKTPLVIYLANELTARGFHPGIISRGYGRKTKQIFEATPSSSPLEVGDEPCIIARQALDCPTFVGTDKHQVAQKLLEEHPMVNILISDDGLQHYSLERDIEICLVDGDNPFGNGFIFPAGPLREPISRLNLVDLIVTKNNLYQRHGDIPTFKMSLNGTTMIKINDPEIMQPLSNLKEKMFNAVAGIGNPHHFFELLKRNDLAFRAFPFPDHHVFSPNDLKFDNPDPILMTEKDAIKCSAFATDDWWMLPVKAEIDESFIEAIIKKIRDKHGH